MCELIGTQYTALLSKNNNGVLVFIKAGGIIIKFMWIYSRWGKNFSVFLPVFFLDREQKDLKLGVRVLLCTVKRV